MYVAEDGVRMLKGPGGKSSKCDEMGRHVNRRTILRPPSFEPGPWAELTAPQRREAWTRFWSGVDPPVTSAAIAPFVPPSVLAPCVSPPQHGDCADRCSRSPSSMPDSAPSSHSHFASVFPSGSSLRGSGENSSFPNPSEDTMENFCLSAAGRYLSVLPPQVSPVRIALDRVSWPRSPRQYVPGGGFCIGATRSRKGSYLCAPLTPAQHACVSAVNSLISSLVPSSFRWTSLQFNRNTVASPHTDRNNLGLSLVLILGDYSGGSLHVPGRDLSTPPGSSPIGVFIDGREPHHSDPFTGLRYSIVAFVHDAFHSLSQPERLLLSGLGFSVPLPPDAAAQPSPPPTVSPNAVCARNGPLSPGSGFAGPAGCQERPGGGQPQSSASAHSTPEQSM